MRLHVPAARRSGVALLMAGFIAGIVLTMTALSLMRDEHVLAVASVDENHLNHHHLHGGHQHRHGGSDEDLKVVDLSEQDKHKHSGQKPLPRVWSCVINSV